MKLNKIKPAKGSKPAALRVGRGIGSTKGKTCGRGHKGQKSRSGGSPAVGFEGGQMPLQRRLPKSGFRSRKCDERAQVRLHELNKLTVDVIDLDALKAVGVVPQQTKVAKVILSGTLDKSVTLKNILVTKGAEKAITAAGGKVEG